MASTPIHCTDSSAGLLDAIDRARLSPIEALVLMHVAHEDATVGDLAQTLDRRPADARRATARLVSRGLLRRRSDRSVRWGHTFTATRAGVDALRALALELTPANRRDLHHGRAVPSEARQRRARSGTRAGPCAPAHASRTRRSAGAR